MVTPRLPTPGSDVGTWGSILNDFLRVEHNDDGTLKAAGSLAKKADDTSVVHKFGSETIDGAKVFATLPKVPVTPTDPAHITSKSYVDSLVTTDSLTISTAQDVLGTKTFTPETFIDKVIKFSTSRHLVQSVTGVLTTLWHCKTQLTRQLQPKARSTYRAVCIWWLRHRQIPHLAYDLD